MLAKINGLKERLTVTNTTILSNGLKVKIFRGAIIVPNGFEAHFGSSSGKIGGLNLGVGLKNQLYGTCKINVRKCAVLAAFKINLELPAPCR